MIPEITIKISFAPTADGGRAEPTVTALDIAPPGLSAEAAAQIPPPPQVDEGIGATAADVPPPPTLGAMADEDIPPLPTSEYGEESTGEPEEPPPTPRSRGRGRAE
jgi:hypothetical protein